MQTNILWTGSEYHSLENCICNFGDGGNSSESTIVGYYQQQLYKVEYVIETNTNWETTSVTVSSQVNDKRTVHRYDSDGKGNWTKNGKAVDEFKGCIDVDLPLTPFTNTLPIRRLGLGVHESAEILVMYLDILQHEFKAVKQKYERRSGTTYKYENIPNDFEALITVDLDGIVVDYPGLFTRTACVESKYDLGAAARLGSRMALRQE
jgi:uncharacterized protein